MSNYRDELVQVAAVAVAMLQVEFTDTTEIKSPGGKHVQELILGAVQMERLRQEAKWGPRNSEGMSRDRWLTVLTEEVGEVARAILEEK